MTSVRILRQPREQDATVLFPYVYRTRVVENLQWDGPESLESFLVEWKRIVERAARHENNFFVITHAVTNEAIGACSVRVDDRGTGDLGIWIGEPHHGSGIGTRALAELVQYSFLVLGLQNLGASIFVDNWPSRRVFEKNGFVLKGVTCGTATKFGQPRDEWQMTLTHDRELSRPTTGCN
jgi:RimJ/RimL family protein N-acetyltransferase